jgi:hypothetical protein
LQVVDKATAREEVAEKLSNWSYLYPQRLNQNQPSQSLQRAQNNILTLSNEERIDFEGAAKPQSKG